MTSLPRLACGPAPDAVALQRLYVAAQRNLVEVNVVDSAQGQLIRAGGGYPEPWTRDASINSWYAGSLLIPEVARRTLLSVCETAGDGTRLIAQDNQWWDQMIWAPAAWHHYVVTGDEDFLSVAYPIARDTAAVAAATRFDARYGLYRGPAVMQDGISGYPAPPAEPTVDSSFVLDFPAAASIMCLSTNAVYVGAERAMARMAEALGADPSPHREAATALSEAVNRHLWRDDAGTYGYFLHGPGPLYGRVDTHQEAMGLALAVRFDVAGPAQRERIFATAHRDRAGMVNVWPSFPRFDDDHPGRHNAICWPMVMGTWADASARAGRHDVFAASLADLIHLFSGSDDGLFELYNATTGAVDGGWQQGRQWRSQPDQTWSATALLGAVHHRLAGLRLRPDGVRLRPSVPAGWGPIRLRDLPYRGATLDVTVTGAGSRVGSVTVDGVAAPADGPAVAAHAVGHHDVVVALEPEPAP